VSIKTYEPAGIKPHVHPAAHGTLSINNDAVFNSVSPLLRWHGDPSKDLQLLRCQQGPRPRLLEFPCNLFQAGSQGHLHVVDEFSYTELRELVTYCNIKAFEDGTLSASSRLKTT
jgi:hypothetical protein